MDAIRAICFDLDGVYFTSKGKNSFHEGLINEYGVAKEVIDELMYRSPLMAQLVRGQVTPEEFWDQFRITTGITVSDMELTERWVRDYEVDQNVRRAVLRARQLGYKTCVCTNNNAIRLPVLTRKFNLTNDFDVIVSSHEVGETKPNEVIFQALVSRLGVKPQELVYSDDNPTRLIGAVDLGIHTFVFEGFDRFIEQLKDCGVDLT